MSEGWLNDILSVIPGGAVIHDAQGRVEACNERAGRMLGLAGGPGSVVPWMDPAWRAVREDGSPFPADGHPALVALRTGQPVSDVVMGIRQPDGGLRRLSFSSRALVRKGRAPAAISVFTEVRQEVESALRESEERYSALFDRSLDCVFLLDLEGNILDANQASLDLMGYSREDIGKVAMASLVPADQVPRARRAIEELLLKGRQQSPAEYRALKKGGEPVFVEVHSSVIYRDGKPYAVQGIARDISARRRSEAEQEKLRAQLLQAQKMESIGRLAGGVAHDFNNLLTVINGYSEAVLARLSVADPLRGPLAEIHKAGERAAELTRQLLAFSRQQVLQPRRLDLNRVVEGIQSMLRRLVGEHIQVSLALEETAVPVQADPHQLEQVIINLAVNARDAMPEGGRLLIETALVAADDGGGAQGPPGGGRRAMLAVSDTGVGIEEATRQRMFEPFYTTKPAGEGTGLGLSMVEGIVAQSGGSIEVSSEPGRGSTFRIYLPVAAEVAAGRVSNGKETVLVVEDQAQVRQYTVAVLRERGYQVVAASSAAEALAVCERGSFPIHLVLTDVVMPHGNGRELAARLAEARPGLKVLFMSGYTDTAVSDGVAEKGAQFIQKPFSPDELAAKIRQVLEAPGPAARVLVADDEAAVRSFLRGVLEAGGYEVVEAAEGREALRKARSERVAVVITDLVMPGREGLETIQSLRRELPAVKIIAISGAFGGRFLESARLLGADAVLDKPVDAELLLSKVAEVL